MTSEILYPGAFPLARVHLDYADEDLALLERSRELVKDIYAKVGASNISEAQITFSRHLQGTCRMGDDPKTSVVNPDRSTAVTCTNTSVPPPGEPGAALRSTGGWMIAWLTKGTRSWLKRYQRFAFSS